MFVSYFFFFFLSYSFVAQNEKMNAESLKEFNIMVIPTELLYMIFEFLEFGDKVQCASVCQRWYNILTDRETSNNNSVWRMHDLLVFNTGYERWQEMEWRVMNHGIAVERVLGGISFEPCRWYGANESLNYAIELLRKNTRYTVFDRCLLKTMDTHGITLSVLENPPASKFEVWRAVFPTKK